MSSLFFSFLSILDLFWSARANSISLTSSLDLFDSVVTFLSFSFNLDNSAKTPDSIKAFVSFTIFGLGFLDFGPYNVSSFSMLSI